MTLLDTLSGVQGALAGAALAFVFVALVTTTEGRVRRRRRPALQRHGGAAIAATRLPDFRELVVQRAGQGYRARAVLVRDGVYRELIGEGTDVDDALDAIRSAVTQAGVLR